MTMGFQLWLMGYHSYNFYALSGVLGNELGLQFSLVYLRKENTEENQLHEGVLQGRKKLTSLFLFALAKRKKGRWGYFLSGYVVDR